MKRVTIKDLAKMLSLTPSTVSRALSDHPGISSHTKERVRHTAMSFNYIPNLHARYFRKKRSGLIAAIIPEFNAFFTPGLLAGIQDVIASNGYSMIILNTENKLEQELKALEHCLSWVVEGILIILSDETTYTSHLDKVKNESVPLVMLDKVLPTKEYSVVNIDDYAAAYNASKLLIQKGGNHFLGVFAGSGLHMTEQRKKGFDDAFTDHFNASANGRIHSLHINDIKKAEENIAAYITQNGMPDGVFAMSDELMVHCYRPVFHPDKPATNNPSMICISDGIAPYHFPKRVTHVLHSGYQIGFKGASHLMEVIKDPAIGPKNIHPDTELVILDT
jgi:LacI family transcriptional regulator